MNRILTILFACLLSSASGQHFLNLDFEYETKGTNRPRKWRLVNQGYAIELDTSEHASSGKSIRIQSDNPAEEDFGVCAMNFPVSVASGKNIEFRARIKTEDVTNGYAGIFWAAVNGDMSYDFDKMEDRGLKGTNGWTDVKIDDFRDIGALKTEDEFSETNLKDDFDLIIFINKSSGSTLLHLRWFILGLLCGFL